MWWQVDRQRFPRNKEKVLAEWQRHFRELSTFQSEVIPQIAEAAKKLPELEFPGWTVIRCWMKSLWRLRVPSRESSEERGQAEITSVQNVQYHHPLKKSQIAWRPALSNPFTRVGGKTPWKLAASEEWLSHQLLKLLEYTILECMKPILFEFNSPHFLQTAYQRGVSYDAIFATQEAALKVLREARHSYHFST